MNNINDTNSYLAVATKKQIMIILVLSFVILISLGGAIFFALKINSADISKKRNALASGRNIYIVILEYEVEAYKFKINSEPKEVASFLFTDDLDIVYRFENEHGYNLIQIKNGRAQVIEADCRDKVCERFFITNKTSLFESNSIICYPHGLKVIWEARD